MRPQAAAPAPPGGAGQGAFVPPRARPRCAGFLFRPPLASAAAAARLRGRAGLCSVRRRAGLWCREPPPSRRGGSGPLSSVPPGGQPNRLPPGDPDLLRSHGCFRRLEAVPPWCLVAPDPVQSYERVQRTAIQSRPVQSSTAMPIHFVHLPCEGCCLPAAAP